MLFRSYDIAVGGARVVGDKPKQTWAKFVTKDMKVANSWGDNAF